MNGKEFFFFAKILFLEQNVTSRIISTNMYITVFSSLPYSDEELDDHLTQETTHVRHTFENLKMAFQW